MEEQKNHLLPSNFVTIIQLKQRWLEKKEQGRRELEKPEEQNRDQRQEIQPGELGEMSEEMRLMENLNLHALETDSQVRDRHQRRKSKLNRFASVKNQGTAEASRVKEEPLVLEEKEQRRRELKKPEEQNRDQRQEIQPGELGEMSEELRLMENLNLHALETDSQVRDRHQRRKSKHNRFALVKNQGTAEASRGKEEPLVLDVKLDGPPDMGSENKANDLELAVKGKKRQNYEKKKQTTAVVEKNPKSEGEPTQDQDCEVAMKHREHLPEVNGKKLRRGGRKTDKKKGIEDEYGPNSGNVNQIWEIGGKSRHISINDETKTEDNRCMKHKNGIRQGYRDARVNVRLNRQEVQKEKGGAFVWVRKEEISSGVGYGFHSQVSGGSIDGPSGKQERLNK